MDSGDKHRRNDLLFHHLRHLTVARLEHCISGVLRQDCVLPHRERGCCKGHHSAGRDTRSDFGGAVIEQHFLAVRNFAVDRRNRSSKSYGCPCKDGDPDVANVVTDA